MAWCQAVTNCVRFKPDRPAIKKELAAHYEDHVRDLERIGFDWKLAQERALGAMGDPVEVGQAMDRAHKPWLGWLWRVSCWLVIIACVLALWNLAWNGWPELRQSVSEIEKPTQELLEASAYPASFRAGAYRMDIEWVQYALEEERDRYNMTISLTASTPKFWLEGPNFRECLEAVDSNGTRYRMHWYPFINGSGPNSGHLENACWIQLHGLENDPEWVDSIHKTAGWTIRGELPHGEEGTP